MKKQRQISSSSEIELNRLYKLFENGTISTTEYELRRKEILSKLNGIPKSNNLKKVKQNKTNKLIAEPSNQNSKIKVLFPVLLISFLLIGLSFKIIPELEQKGTIIVKTIEESLPKGVVLPSIKSTAEEEYSSPLPQINVPAPTISESTITTPVTSNPSPNTTVDDYLSNDKSTHIFTIEEASGITYNLQSKLGINAPRIMNFGTPSIYKGQGIINTSVVKGGYYLFSDKPKSDNNIILTIFVIEQGKEDQFFKELSNYMGQFDVAYNINFTYYEKIDGPIRTNGNSIQYQFKFYPNGNDSIVSNVRLISIKRSNLVVYIYYLDSSGDFNNQKVYEETIMSYLNNYS